MNVDFHEMEQGASIRRRQNQAAPDKGGWSAFFGLVDRSLPNNASCSRCPLSTSRGTPASSRALRMIDEILFCGAARFALEPRAIGEPPSCQAAPTGSHPPIIIGGGRGFDNHGYRGSVQSSMLGPGASPGNGWAGARPVGSAAGVAAAGGSSSSRPSNPAASPASGPSPRSGSIAHEQHPVVTAPIALPVRRRRYPAGNSRQSADGTLSLDLGRQNPDPSARRHGAHGTHANQNHRSRYPFKPAVPSESGQVAQNLTLNPHRPTLPPAHTPPRFPPSRLFGRLPPRSPSRSDWQASENPLNDQCNRGG